MRFENLIQCKRCQGDACYYQEVSDEFKVWQCFGCGFASNSLMKKEEKYFQEQYEIMPKLYQDLMFEDDEGKMWMPATINLPDKGMVFINGTSLDNWKWAVVRAVPIPEEEKEKYPIPNKEGEYYEHRVDMSTLQEFEPKDFMEAADVLGMFEVNLEN